MLVLCSCLQHESPRMYVWFPITFCLSCYLHQPACGILYIQDRQQTVTRCVHGCSCTHCRAAWYGAVSSFHADFWCRVTTLVFLNRHWDNSFPSNELRLCTTRKMTGYIQCACIVAYQLTPSLKSSDENRCLQFDKFAVLKCTKQFYDACLFLCLWSPLENPIDRQQSPVSNLLALYRETKCLCNFPWWILCSTICAEVLLYFFRMHFYFLPAFFAPWMLSYNEVCLLLH